MEALDQLRGSYQGHPAKVVEKSSDLSDIQEEIGNSVGKLADKRTLETSRLRKGAGVNKEALTRIADFYDRLPDAPHEDKLRELVGNLQDHVDRQEEGTQAGKGLNDVYHLLRSSSDSDRQAYMLLQAARLHFAGTETGDALLPLFDQVEDKFYASQTAQDVRADYAVLVHAREAGAPAAVQTALSDKYRDMLLSGMDLGILFSTLSSFYKRLSFQAVIDIYLQAASDDLEMLSREGDKAFLGKLLGELGILKTLRSTYEAAQSLLARSRRLLSRFGKMRNSEKDGSEEEEDDDDDSGVNALMAELLSFCSKRTAALDDGRRLIRTFDRDEDPVAGVIFGNGVLEIHRDMPDTVFPSTQVRLHQLNVLVEICSDLTAIEDENFTAGTQILTEGGAS